MKVKTNEVIKPFLEELNKAKTVADYQLILIKFKKTFIYHTINFKKNNLTFKHILPFLAIVAKVYELNAQAVQKLAEVDSFFKAALNLLLTYSEDEQKQLRNQYL